MINKLQNHVYSVYTESDTRGHGIEFDWLAVVMIIYSCQFCMVIVIQSCNIIVNLRAALPLKIFNLIS